jgi:hypothetical protein
MFLVRPTILAHYYYGIGARLSGVGNYKTRYAG